MTKKEAIDLLNKEYDFYAKAYNQDYSRYEKDVRMAICQALVEVMHPIKELTKRVKEVDNLKKHESLILEVRKVCYL